MSASLEQVLERGRDAYTSSLRSAAERQTWEQVAQPLVRWVRDPVAPRRPAEDAPDALHPPLAQRLREAAYLGGGRTILARISARR